MIKKDNNLLKLKNWFKSYRFKKGNPALSTDDYIEYFNIQNATNELEKNFNQGVIALSNLDYEYFENDSLIEFSKLINEVVMKKIVFWKYEEKVEAFFLLDDGKIKKAKIESEEAKYVDYVATLVNTYYPCKTTTKKQDIEAQYNCYGNSKNKKKKGK